MPIRRHREYVNCSIYSKRELQKESNHDPVHSVAIELNASVTKNVVAQKDACSDVGGPLLFGILLPLPVVRRSREVDDESTGECCKCQGRKRTIRVIHGGHSYGAALS